MLLATKGENCSFLLKCCCSANLKALLQLPQQLPHLILRFELKFRIDLRCDVLPVAFEERKH